ncbi:MAG: hypothetical protein AAF703_06500 [Cyanobacteria bacterium P01_D01_bin.105]
MARKVVRPIKDPLAKKKMDQFRQDLEHEVEHGIDHHENKMIYIGFATLGVFAIVLYGAWNIQIF